MRACLCLLYCLLPVLTATAAPVEDTWMRVMLDGRKIGSMHTTRFENGDRIITTQALDVELDRAERFRSGRWSLPRAARVGRRERLCASRP